MDNNLNTPSPLCSDENSGEHFYYHEGRRMPAQGNYFLPADQEEFDRLERMHQITTAVLGGLFWGPVDRKLTPRPSGRRRCVLDIGTGTGSWVREMAEKYEHADFVGADIVPIPPPASTIAEIGGPSLLKTTYDEPEYEGGSIYSGVRFSLSSENITSILLGTPTTTAIPLSPAPGMYEYTPLTPYSSYGTPGQTEVKYTERPNVRFELQDLCHKLDYPDGVFDIVHCRYVLTLGIPDFRSAIKELLRVLRPGGLLLLAEASVPFCISDGTDPPHGTASRELIEIVKASIREGGLDPDLRLKLNSELRANPQIDKIDTCDFPLPLGPWPEDVALQAVGGDGLDHLALGLRSLTPLLRQVGFDDAMMSMLASRLHEEWDIEETGKGVGKCILCTFVWATKRR